MSSKTLRKLAAEACSKAAPAETALRKNRGAMELIRGAKRHNETHPRSQWITIDRLRDALAELGTTVTAHTLRKVYRGETQV